MSTATRGANFWDARKGFLARQQSSGSANSGSAGVSVMPRHGGGQVTPFPAPRRSTAHVANQPRHAALKPSLGYRLVRAAARVLLAVAGFAAATVIMGWIIDVGLTAAGL